MRSNCLGVPAAAVVAMLSGCASPAPSPLLQYKNADHPSYGQTEYNKDLADCQAANTHAVQGGGYTEHNEVDANGAKSCLAGRGWR